MGELSLTDEPEGPFRTESGPCGADRELLRSRYGVPDELIDDVLVWWHDHRERPVPAPREWEYQHREREALLCRRLRAAVPGGVFVRPADFVPQPVVVRMFVDDTTGIALWASSVGWPPRPSFEEVSLPVSESLRARIREWVEEYTDSIIGPWERYGSRWRVQHDRRGHALSQELDIELGDGYVVRYEPHTRALRDPELPQSVSLHGLSDQELETLPPLPASLRERLRAWLSQRSLMQVLSQEASTEWFAWEDDGRSLRDDLRQIWGPRYDVRL